MSLWPLYRRLTDPKLPTDTCKSLFLPSETGLEHSFWYVKELSMNGACMLRVRHEYACSD